MGALTTWLHSWHPSRVNRVRNQLRHRRQCREEVGLESLVVRSLVHACEPSPEGANRKLAHVTNTALSTESVEQSERRAGGRLHPGTLSTASRLIGRGQVLVASAEVDLANRLTLGLALKVKCAGCWIGASTSDSCGREVRLLGYPCTLCWPHARTCMAVHGRGSAVESAHSQS